MAAVVKDQFRILNAGNFIDSVSDTNNSYYAFLGFANPTSPNPGFGRTSNWDTNTPNPVDNFQYISHYRDSSLFGKKVTSANVRRVIRKVDWTSNTAYDMYRHDYSIYNPTPISKTSRLYDANYYVVNSDYRVYICIDNGSSGTNPTGGRSLDEPTFTDVDPSSAGSSGDGYIWKYLFSVAPSDIIKFDSTEYVVVPNDWATSTNTDIQTIREGGDSEVNDNQIKKVYIEDGGSGYTAGTYDILGDGSGGEVSITVNSSGTITGTSIVSGGKGYTYGIVDLKRTGTISNPAKLIPIIPPSRGHGYDVYTELGTDKVLIYARFDDSTKDFPIDTQFSQIGLIKNPQQFASTSIFTENAFSSLYAIKLANSYTGTPVIGDRITQSVTGGTAQGYVASYDSDTKVLKYYQDRSLYFSNDVDQTDANDVGTVSKVLSFSGSNNISFDAGGSASINTSFSDSSVLVDNKQINLGVTFSSGLANPEINKKTGDVIYINNRPLIERNIRQKEDVKIILEF